MGFAAPRALASVALAVSVGLVTPNARANALDNAPQGCEPIVAGVAAAAVGSTDAFPPLQLEARTPVPPTTFPSAGRTYLVYELHLRNFGHNALELRRLDVSDADSPTGTVLATFERERLHALLQPNAPTQAADPVPLARGEGAVAFLCLAFASEAPLPQRLTHRFETDVGAGDGPTIPTRSAELRSLNPPVAGATWLASSATSNDSHHRLGLLVVDGEPRLARRFAIDWLRVDTAGQTFAGDALDNASYYAYGEPVRAVADGKVAAVIDGLPDNVPRTERGFQTAVPMTAHTIAGNYVAIDLGGGLFATYAHLQPGSIRVKPGDRVRRGEPIARIGASGDAREAHLHFQVTTTLSAFDGEGLPYVIEAYRVAQPDGSWQERRHELPVADMRVDFGTPRENR